MSTKIDFLENSYSFFGFLGVVTNHLKQNNLEASAFSRISHSLFSTKILNTFPLAFILEIVTSESVQ